MSEEIRNEQANRIVESPGDTGPIMTPDKPRRSQPTRQEASSASNT
jgi:hypothetical protein